MDLGLKGKRALVMGGGKGIGRGIAEALAREGADVAIASRNQATLDEAVAAFKAYGVRAVAIASDLTKAGAAEALYKHAKDALGGVDILVNNGGGPPPTDAVSVTDELWMAQFQAMVLSFMHLTTLALPAMRAQKWGRIMTVSSAGVIQPIPGLAISNTLRAAVAGWSKTLANEVARDGITVNVLLPGSIQTERIAQLRQVWAEKSGRSMAEIEAEQNARIPVGRTGTIEEFGAVAAFIASTQASYITGSMIRIDGGMIAST